jgi:2'-5' RNA ligase
MLFHDQLKVHELVARAQEKLVGQPGLDMIEMPWLHMTTYIVGFADEVPDAAIQAMTAGARRRLSEVAPIQVSLGRVGYASNAIVLPVEPPGALTPVLDAVRAATRAAGCEGHTDTDPWLPHISIAYSNATIPAAPIIAALGRRLPQTEITIRSISLVSQTQVGRSWQWRPVAEVHFTGEPAPAQ